MAPDSFFPHDFLFTFYFFFMNIFVAKLDWNTSSEGLLEAFERYGEVSSAKVIMDRETGRSKGYGFVEMPNDDEGREAISSLNGSMLDGRAILVKESDPAPKDNRGGGGGFRNKRPRIQRGRDNYSRDNNRDRDSRDRNRDRGYNRDNRDNRDRNRNNYRDYNDRDNRY